MNRMTMPYLVSLTAITFGSAVIGLVLLARTAPEWMNANKSIVTAATLTITITPWIIAVWRLRKG